MVLVHPAVPQKSLKRFQSLGSISSRRLGILAGLGRFQELGIYTNAAVGSGVTVDEIKEAWVQITVYCGTPVGRQAFLAAHEVLNSPKD